MRYKEIYHRDLKSSNIFLHNGRAIIADFGFATHQANSDFIKINVGSPLYMAPETLSSLNFSEKSEVFGLGIILYEMLTGKTPWRASSEK